MEGLSLLAVVLRPRLPSIPGAGELEAMSSSSSLNLFLREGPGRFLFAALILGRRGELILPMVWEGFKVERKRRKVWSHVLSEQYLERDIYTTRRGRKVI